MQEKVPTSTNVQSVRIELTKLIFVGTRVTYQATGDVRTCRHPAHPVSALLLHPREIQALWSQNYDTGSYVVPGRQQWYNAMPQHNIRQLPRLLEPVL